MAAARQPQPRPASVVEESRGRLQLRLLDAAPKALLQLDWDGAELARRLTGLRKQTLIRAVGLHKQRNPQIIDCTAGLGRDSFSMAAAGGRVLAYERNPVLLALLQHEQARLRAGRRPPEQLAQLRIIAGDARTALQPSSCDVVYLDPMYPDDRRHALAAMPMQILSAICGADSDAHELLPLALAAATRRVVVKRPRRASPLAGAAPSMTMQGKQARFDIYFTGGRGTP